MSDALGIKVVITDADGQTEMDMSCVLFGGVLKDRPEHVAGGQFGTLAPHDVVNAYLTVCRAFIHATQEQVEVMRETIGRLSGKMPERASSDLKEVRRMMVRILDEAIKIEEDQSEETLNYKEGIVKYRIGPDHNKV